MKDKYLIKYSEEEGELVGIFAGDGSQYYYKKAGHYYTTIHFGDVPNYVRYVKKIYDSYFKKNWCVWKEIPKYGNPKYRIRVVDMTIFNHFLNYLSYDRKRKHDTVKLINFDFPDSFKIGFLRGFLDTDGTVANCKKRIRVQYYTTSKNLSKQISLFLSDLGINNGLCKISRLKNKDIYYIYVLQGDVDSFLKLIKPYKGKWVGR